MLNGAPLFWVYQAVFLAYLAFSLGVALRSAWARLAKLLFVALLTTALWAQASALAMYAILPYWAYNLAATLRDASWLAFCLGLIHARMQDSRYWRMLLGATIGLVLLECAFEVGALPGSVIAGVRVDSSLTHVFITIFGVFLIENIVRNASRAQLWALKHWAIGLLAILAIELATRVPEFLTHTPLENLAIATPLIFLIALPLFVVSLTRLPQVNLRVHSSRTFVFHTATLIAAGILLQGVAFAAWYVRSYGGSNATAIQVIVAFAGVVAVAAILVSSSVRSRFRRFIDENFFSLKYDYRIVWEKVIRGLDPEKTTAERLLSVLCDLMDSPGGAIWFWRESWQRYVPAAQTGVSAGIAPLPEQDAGMDYLRDGEQSFVSLAEDAAGEKRFAAWQTYVDDAWIIVPLRHRSSIVGIAILKRPRAPRKLDWEEQGLVRLVALQLAAHFVQEETAQSLADARQLEDFNKRFAFVVHDIKNTIGQLSLLVGNIAKFGEQKEFRDDMVLTLGNSVERLQSLLKSLTAVGSAGPRNNDQVIDIIEFLTAFTQDKQKLGYNVVLDPGDMTPSPFKTDSATLRRVLDHVVSNAVEASDPGGKVEIALTGAGPMVRICVTDHGRGMTEQFIRDELFRMMRTTKGGGFGIGGYQIRQLMRDLGGEVTVDSVIGQGTCVTLSLPQFAGTGAS